MTDAPPRAVGILITRPREQAHTLTNMIESLGWTACVTPVITIEAYQPDSESLDFASHANWLVFTSTNAVRFANCLFDGKMNQLSARIAAIGQATANALNQLGLRIDCVPKATFSTEGLLAEPAFEQVAGMTCVIVTGEGGRTTLAEILSARGAKVHYLRVYRRLPATTDNPIINHFLEQGLIDAVTITSIEILDNLLKLLTPKSRSALQQIWLVVGSDRIAQYAQELGFSQIKVSAKPTDTELVETLKTLFDGEKSGGRN